MPKGWTPYALGRIVEHDPRSRAYNIEPRLAPTPIKTVHWVRYAPILDQGNLGSCTGNAMVGWLGTAPYASQSTVERCTEDLAVQLYGLATHLDKWPGQYPPDDTGSSGLAVAKAAKRTGLIKSYTWAFTTSGLLRALQRQPVLLGTIWLSDMFDLDADGFLKVSGSIVGGHEYVCRGYNADEGYLFCDNSWGQEWGLDGSFKLRLSDWEALRKQQADVTVPHIY